MGRLQRAVLLQDRVLMQQYLRLHLPLRLLLRHGAKRIVVRGALKHWGVATLYLRGNCAALHGSLFVSGLSELLNALDGLEPLP